MGRKHKQKKKITGLRNQPKAAVPPLHSSPTPEPVPESQESRADDPEEDVNWSPHTRFDSLKVAWDGNKSEDEEDDTEIGTEEEWGDWNELGQEGLHVMLMKLAMENGDDPRDEDWVPEVLRRKKARVTSEREFFIF
jgi:hypothetical protein